MPIPNILHQTWKSLDLPKAYIPLQQSWRELNPAWEYRFWDDAELERFVKREFPQYLDLYLGYPQNISRIDLARYLLLWKYGGVYADLDYECLRPLDSWLPAKIAEGGSLIVGLEPASHVKMTKAAQRGITKILCPTFIASEAGHPFWPHLIQILCDAREEADVLDRTGPFILTRAYDTFQEQGRIALLPADVAYPFDKEEAWAHKDTDIVEWERRTRSAVGHHYWEGTWFKSDQRLDRRTLTAAGSVARGENVRNAPVPLAIDSTTLPMISCLMVTKGRVPQARHAIECFVNQTYPNRELVIIEDSGKDEMRELVEGYSTDKIRLFSHPVGERPLGKLRNESIERATGEYVCQWDDDDLYDPYRLEIQYGAIRRAKTHASMLTSVVEWWPRAKRLAVPPDRPWEGSLMCERRMMPRFPALRRGEDSLMMTQLMRNASIAMLHCPRLYMYVAHENNTWGLSHFESHWRGSNIRYEGSAYVRLVRELSKRLPMESYRAALETRPEPKDGRNTRIDKVTVIGHLNASVGVSIAARSTLDALASAGVPTDSFNLSFRDERPQKANTVGRRMIGSADGINIIHANPDHLLNSLAAKRAEGWSIDSVKNAYNIGIWAWETDSDIPPNWKSALPGFREIWAPSTFAAKAIAKNSPVPVVVIPHAVRPPKSSLSRAEAGLRNGEFTFFFAFDATSNITRKNPQGLIRAFKLAFPESQSAARLLIKAKKLSPKEVSELQALAGDRDDITIVNEEYSAERMAACMLHSDCYISLHRSEGFGLSLAEAMAIGKPVIATGYGGNIDFMLPQHALLIDHGMCVLESRDGAYAAGTVWGEPKLEHAAELMLNVFRDPVMARDIGERARQWAREHLAPEKIGQMMKERIALNQNVLTREKEAKSGKVAGDKSFVAANSHGIDNRSGAGIARSAEGELPTVLVLTPVKDAGKYIERYIELLANLSYPHDKISLAFLESDSSDSTLGQLRTYSLALEGNFASVQIYKRDYGLLLSGERWLPGLQRKRRHVLARSRNYLLSRALRDEQWVLWLDVDLVDYPPDIIEQLLATRKDIVTPNCVLPNGQVFDLNAFKFTNGGDRTEHMIDGLFQPPRGDGRRYLDELATTGDLVELDSVGGTILLVRADLHREGLVFPAYSHRGYIETEGLAMAARDLGIRCWGMPNLRVVHTDGKM